ncbi:MAG: PAS domain S-box protein [Opitutaceae bacterium]|nr:PAS domain S-box protein [Opitutaceae bacterium]
MSGLYQDLGQLPDHVRAATLRFFDETGIIAITDLKGTIVYANETFARISGYPREELIGQNHRILKSGQHPAEFYREMWRVVAHGEVWTGEICNRARDGRFYWVESTISPLRDSTGRITHYCALRIDITARKEAQQRLLDAMEQNAERRHLESLGRMADGILHDLNNLLGGAMMLTDIGDHTPQDVEEQRTFLRRMAQLIRNVRDFSTGRAPEMKVCDAARALTEACRLASHVARREREVTIEIDARAAEGCTVRVNEAQLLEIVLNLFTNAVEALTGHPEPAIKATASLDANRSRLHLTITDNGPGVPEAVTGRLFEPFVSSKGRGRGVGLAAARRLARGLGGDLVQVTATAGACFRLTLPAATRVPEATPVADAGAVAVPQGGLVLLADDDREFLGMLEAGLRESGFRTISAGAADDAILLAEQFRDQLAAAVLDSVGAVKECALVGYLRTVRRGLPIVLVSGSLARPGVQQTQHGPVHVLPKPFAAADLVALLRQPEA